MLVGTPVANRGRVELEPLIGFFTNTLVMRADLTPATTGAELLQQVRDRSLTAFAHQNLPVRAPRGGAGPDPRDQPPPVFQVDVRAPERGVGRPPAGGPRGRPRYRCERDTTMFDLLLYVDEQPDGLHPLFQYNSDLFDEATVARMAGHYRTLLAASGRRPEPPTRPDRPADGGRATEIEGWNRTDNGLGPADRTGGTPS